MAEVKDVQEDEPEDLVEEVEVQPVTIWLEARVVAVGGASPNS